MQEHHLVCDNCGKHHVYPVDNQNAVIQSSDGKRLPEWIALEVVDFSATFPYNFVQPKRLILCSAKCAAAAMATVPRRIDEAHAESAKLLAEEKRLIGEARDMAPPVRGIPVGRRFS